MLIKQALDYNKEANIGNISFVIVFVLIHFHEQRIRKDFKGDSRGHMKVLLREFRKEGRKVEKIF